MTIEKSKGTHKMRRYFYFRIGTPILPTFYETLWELTNDMVLHIYIQVKQKEQNRQEEMINNNVHSFYVK